MKKYCNDEQSRAYIWDFSKKWCFDDQVNLSYSHVYLIKDFPACEPEGRQVY